MDNIVIKKENTNPLSARIVLGAGNVNITSIPSPYARMHLFNAAFENVIASVASGGNPTANRSKFHRCGIDLFDKLISDCLDLFELFYNYERLDLEQKGISVEFYKIKDLKNIFDDNTITEEHKGFWDTLNVYASGYCNKAGFANAKFDVGYFIKNEANIFAGTSPFTGFFASSHIGYGFEADKKKYFSDLPIDWKGIADRETDFQEFLYQLLYRTNFSKQYEQLFGYINSYATTNGLAATWNAKDYDLKPYGFNLDGVPVFGNIVPDSGFNPEIKAIVIPNKYHTTFFKYLLEPQEGIKFELSREDYNPDINARIFQGKVQGWLSVDDFFRDYIIEVKKDNNSNLETLDVFNDNGFSVDYDIVVPMKDRFFEYYSYESLKERIKVVRLSPEHYLIKVRISTENGDILLQKEYKKRDNVYPEGLLITIEESEDYLSIYPFLKGITDNKEQGKGFENFNLDILKIRPDYEQKKEENLPIIIPDQYNSPLFTQLINSDGSSSQNLKLLKNDYNDKVHERRLFGVKRKWLSVLDFLKEEIIELKDNINTDRFYSCQVFNVNEGKNDDNVKILCPLTDTFYKYFKIFDDEEETARLSKKLRVEKKLYMDGKLEITEYVVFLSIPVEGGAICLKKVYKIAKNEVNESVGSYEYPIGNVIALGDDSFYMGIYPFVKDTSDHKEVSNAFFRVMLYHEDTVGYQCSLSFKRFNEKDGGFDDINSTHVYSKQFKRKDFPVSTYYALERILVEGNRASEKVKLIEDVDFDAIEVKIIKNAKEYSVIILPKFIKVNCNRDKGWVGVDFGTSNTHIVFGKQDGSTLIKDEYSSFYSVDGHENIPTLVMLHRPVLENGKYNFGFESVGKLNELHYLCEFMPVDIAPSREYKFSIQSSLNTRVGNPLNDNSHSLVDANIGISKLGRRKVGLQYADECCSDFKWMADDADGLRIKLFIDQLMLMARSYLIANSYIIENVEVAWTKPLAMTSNPMLIEILNEVWNFVYLRYFSNPDKGNGIGDIDNKRLHSTSESRTPIYARGAIQTHAGVFVAMDIGGGSTDILVYDSTKEINSISLTSSFDFAANDLYNAKNKRDSAFWKILEKELQHEQGGKDLNVQALDKDDTLSVSYLVNWLYNKREVNFFSAENCNLKFLLTLHCSAILYHTAQACLIGTGNENIPSKIVFSGNGANLMKQIPQKKIKDLVDCIFRKVYGVSDDTDTFIQLEYMESRGTVNLKSATSVGCLHWMNDHNAVKNEADQDQYYVLLGDSKTAIKYSDKDAYAQLSKYKVDRSKSVDKQIFIDQIEENVNEFLNAFFDGVGVFGLSFKTFCGNHYKKEILMSPDIVGQDPIRQSLSDYFLEHSELTHSLFFVPIKYLIARFSKYFAE